MRLFAVHQLNHLDESCSAALCPDPAPIVNGMVTISGNSVGDTATYTCYSGFELIGVTTTTCTQVDVNTAGFSPDPPVCRREIYACCLNNLWNGCMYFLLCKSGRKAIDCHFCNLSTSVESANDFVQHTGHCMNYYVTTILLYSTVS